MILKMITRRLFNSTWDYQYSILEHTPYLHTAQQLDSMYKNAKTDYQKACIMNHIVRFDAHKTDCKGYYKIYCTIYDEYR